MRLTNRLFSELDVGVSAEIKRLVTTDDLLMFAAVSGNLNPMHIAVEAGHGDSEPRSVAPGNVFRFAYLGGTGHTIARSWDALPAPGA